MLKISLHFTVNAYRNLNFFKNLKIEGESINGLWQSGKSLFMFIKKAIYEYMFKFRTF